MRVVTYNIQWGMGRDKKVDLARIASTVSGADIICLQEVERFWRKMDHADQVARLSELLPDHFHAFAPSVDINDPTSADKGARRQYGLMTLSRWPILSIRVFPLPKYPVVGHLNDSSCLQELIVGTPGGAIRVYNTHLNYLSERQRHLQIGEIMKIVADAPLQGGPVVGIGVPAEEYYADWMAVGHEDLTGVPVAAMLMGDFNMRPNSRNYDLLTGETDPFYGRLHEVNMFSDVLTIAGQAERDGITHGDTDAAGYQRIDHIFVNGPLVGRVTRAWIDEAADGSDHQPVFVELADA
ncbi:MAG: endonuclease/exonuclease/phosphatase family protein [Rhodobacteraceae bacterium]|nr:endonuclease/exonuclease/phosphatase family protein [Paracoccaceae bacterium]